MSEDNGTRTILAYLNTKRAMLTAAVPRTFQSALTWESIVQSLGASLNDPKNGANLRRCKPESIYLALIKILRLGLDPAPELGQAYLIPRGQECTALIGAQGKIELAYRSGRIDKIVCQVVYAEDHIEIDLAEGTIVHRVTKEQLLDSQEPGEPIAAYARIWVKGAAQPTLELMRMFEFERIRTVAGSANSPSYKNYYTEMWRRSVLNRALKRAPKSTELSEALRDFDLAPVDRTAVDDEPAGGDAPPQRDVVDPDADPPFAQGQPPGAAALEDKRGADTIEAQLSALKTAPRAGVKVDNTDTGEMP